MLGLLMLAFGVFNTMNENDDTRKPCRSRFSTDDDDMDAHHQQQMDEDYADRQEQEDARREEEQNMVYR